MASYLGQVCFLCPPLKPGTRPHQLYRLYRPFATTHLSHQVLLLWPSLPLRSTYLGLAQPPTFCQPHPLPIPWQTTNPLLQPPLMGHQLLTALHVLFLLLSHPEQLNLKLLYCNPRPITNRLSFPIHKWG